MDASRAAPSGPRILDARDSVIEPQRDRRASLQHRLQDAEVDRGLTERATEGIARLRGVHAVGPRVMRVDFPGEGEEGAGEALERAEIRVREAAGQQAADAGCRLDEGDGQAPAGGGEGGGDARRRCADDQDIWPRGRLVGPRGSGRHSSLPGDEGAGADQERPAAGSHAADSTSGLFGWCPTRR
jgi:hypothetical protein